MVKVEKQMSECWNGWSALCMGVCFFVHFNAAGAL